MAISIARKLDELTELPLGHKLNGPFRVASDYDATTGWLDVSKTANVNVPQEPKTATLTDRFFRLSAALKAERELEADLHREHAEAKHQSTVNSKSPKLTDAVNDAFATGLKTQVTNLRREAGNFDVAVAAQAVSRSGPVPEAETRKSDVALAAASVPAPAP